MSERLPGLPAPTPTPTNEGYWTAAAERRFVIQRCGGCGTHRHPPAEVCYSCLSRQWDWDDALPGTGRVFSYIWVHRPANPSLAGLVPYNVAVVEIDGTVGAPVRVVANVFDVDEASLRIDLAVRVTFDPCGDGLALPAFQPAT